MLDIKALNLQEAIDNIPNYEKALQVCARAINDATAKAGTAVSKETRKTYTVSASRIKKGAIPKKATTSRLESKMVFESPMVNMRNYKMSNKNPTYGRGKQLTASVKKGSSATYKGVFFARASKPAPGFMGPVKSTYIAFMKLKGKVGKNGRQAIAPLYGPALKHIMSSKEVLDVFNEVAYETYTKRFEHHMNRTMK